MKTYREEWVVIINKKEYPLDEKQAKVLKDAIASGSRGIVVFGDFSVPIPFIEEFYLKEKVYDVLPALSFENEIKIDEAEKARVRARIEAFKKDFFKKHGIKQSLTEEEVNTRRNKLLDQLKI